MPAFRPCIGTRAQVDATPVRDGQLLVAADTGEVFIDFNGVRVRLSGGGSGESPPSNDEDEEDSLLTAWTVASASLLMSDSVSGGGPGAGILDTPAVLLPETDNDLLTDYSITE